MSRPPMSELHKKLHMSRLPPMIPSGIGRGGGGKRAIAKKKDYSPVSWDKYFERRHFVSTSETDKFQVYESGDSGAALVFLHGGGFSALSWAVLTKCITSQLTCRCLAIDLRGHGESQTNQDDDLSSETMSNDVAKIIAKVYGDDPPPMMLVGHSMGGALAVHICQRGLLPTVAGLAVIDVVEGTAMDALSSMQSFLRGRPSRFKSLENAIEWSVRTGQIRNLESAKVSMVGQLKRIDTNTPAIQEVSTPSVSTVDTITEEEEDQEEGNAKHHKADNSCTDDAAFRHPSEQYTWRIDLANTENHWTDWFRGLSQMFLSCTPAKMLLLAGVDRLDKDLAVGQMQGKFQMQVLPHCGHTVHEDVPDKVADALATFLVRHKLATPTDNINRVYPGC